MEQRIFHGDITPSEIARALLVHFNRGNLVAQVLEDEAQTVLQVGTRRRRVSGGQTALSILLRRMEDGVAVQVGRQAWLGVAASLGVTALSVWRNPFSLLGRLDDLAQDIENLRLNDEVWGVIENVARLRGASFELSQRLRRTVCSYCVTANPVGSAHCMACGAPCGDLQPLTCIKCGFVLERAEKSCPNCGAKYG